MKSKTLWNPQYLFLLLCCTLVSILFYALTPLLSEYTANQLGGTLTIAGVISGLFSITSLLVRPFSGIISDRMDLKKVCLISTLLLGLTTMGYLLAEDILVLASVRILNGIAYAFCSTSCFVLLSRHIPISKLNEGIGYYGVGQILSSALGLTLGIQLSHHINFTFSCLILGCSLLLIAGTLLIIRFPSRTTASTEQKITLWKDFFSPVILPFAIIGAIFSVSNGIETTFLSLIGEERHIINIGFYFTFYVILLLISKPFTGRISDQYGLKAVLYPGLILMAIESVLLGSSYTLIPILIASGCKALGQGSCHPALQTECIKRMGVAKSGLASSIFLLFTDLGQGLGPIIGGYVATKSNYSVMFYGCAGLYVCALLFLNFFLYRKSRNE